MNFLLLDDFSDLISLKSVLENEFKKNHDELQKLATKDSSEANQIRSQLIGQNNLIIAIISRIT